MMTPPPASSSVVWQKLLPLLLAAPMRLTSVVSVVPSGATSLITRSPTQLWSSPTVVAPTAVEQAEPRNLNVTLPTLPASPATGRLATAVAPGTSGEMPSGIGTTGPEYVNVVVLPRPPVPMVIGKLFDGAAPPVKDTVSVKFRFAPQAAPVVRLKRNGVP